MLKILLATDGSEHGRRTVEKVIKLSASMSAPVEVHVLNVQESPVVYGAAEIYLPYEKAEALVKEAGQKIADDAAEALRSAGLSPRPEVAVGEIAPTIVRRAAPNLHWRARVGRFLQRGPREAALMLQPLSRCTLPSWRVCQALAARERLELL